MRIYYGIKVLNVFGELIELIFFLMNDKYIYYYFYAILAGSTSAENILCTLAEMSNMQLFLFPIKPTVVPTKSEVFVLFIIE